MVWPCWYCFMKPKGSLSIDQSTTDEGDRKAQISIAGGGTFPPGINEIALVAVQGMFPERSFKSQSWKKLAILASCV